MINWLKSLIDGRTTNPDVLRFRRAAAAIYIVMALSLLATLWFWRDESALVFAVPAFPTMKDCTNLTADFNEIHDSPEAAAADCQYHLDLLGAYDSLRDLMLEDEDSNQQTPVEKYIFAIARTTTSQGWMLDWSLIQISIEAMVKVLAVITAAFGTFIFYLWRGTSKTHTDDVRYRAQWRIQHYATSFMLSIVMLVLVYLAIDVLWFLFERAVTIPLVYGKGTAILFTILVMGVLTFFLINWVSELRITQLSILAGMVLLAGLIVGMVATNHIWDKGVTNAYSTMSERAYDERLAFEIGGESGSRGIFRLTFISAGIILIVYAYNLRSLVLMMEEQPENYKLTENMVSILRPDYLRNIGSLAGVLIMAVGFFPTDGVCIPVGRCWLNLSRDLSGLLHSIGAFGGVLALLFIIMTFWYIGHPLKSDYVPRMRWLSWIGVTLIGIATIMHFVGYRVETNGLLFGAGMTIGFVVVLFGMLYYAKRLQNGETIELSPKFWQLLNEPLWHGSLIVTIGLIAGRIRPNLMTLVTLEFVILSLFSLFLYSYSLYTVELMDDAQEAEQKQRVSSSGDNNHHLDSVQKE